MYIRENETASVLYSVQRETSDGSLEVVTIKIPYEDKSTLHVLVDDIQITSEAQQTTPYTWVWDGQKVRISPAVASGSEVLIRRVSTADQMKNIFNGQAQFTDQAMDENFKQLLWLAQEYGEGSGLRDVFSNINMHGYKITNTGWATDPDDVVTYGQYLQDAQGARQAAQQAKQALQDAQGILDRAQTVTDQLQQTNQDIQTTWNQTQADMAEAVQTTQQTAQQAQDTLRALQEQIQQSINSATGDIGSAIDTGKAQIDAAVEQAEASVNSTASSAVSTITSTKDQAVQAINEGVQDAQESVQLAKDWAVKMDGLVNNQDYSSKYYANQAKTDADRAQDIKEQLQTAAGDVIAVTDQIKIVADNITDINITADNVNSINTIADDIISSSDVSYSQDYGDLDDTGSTPPTAISGGVIKTVADNIQSVKAVGQLIESGQVQTVIDSVETTSANVTAAQTAQSSAQNARDTAQQHANTASSNATLAKNWAIKMDGTVDGSEYSAKYYAQQAKNTADSVDASTTQIVAAKEDALQSVQEARSAAVTSIQGQGTTQVSKVQQQASTSISAVSAEGTEQVERITTQGGTQVQAVKTQGSNQIELIEEAVGNLQSYTEEAQTAAQTATAQATAAQGHATTAQSAATSAQSAKTAAQTAKTSAQTAASTANAAKTAAQSAADRAQEAAQNAAAGQIQSDWNQTDTGAKDYIKNKPDLSGYALKSEISTIYRYKGTVATYDQLPVDSQAVGDAYNVASDDKSHGIKAGDNVVWNGTYWDNQSGYVDLSPYLTNEAASGIYLRQDTASTTYATKTELTGKLDVSTYTTDKATFATKTQLGNKLDTATYNSQKANFALKSQLVQKSADYGVLA